MDWKKIRLELADTQDHPRGSVSRGYVIYAPLNDNGAVDEQSLEQAPQRAVVRRFWSTEPDEKGQLVPTNGHFALRCRGKPDRLLPIRGESIRLGGCVDIIGDDGRALPFRVASISTLSRSMLSS